jgi:hypothetical protein
MVWLCKNSEKGVVFHYSITPEGKGQAYASPSPLSQWGQFPIFTGVRLSRTGRPPRDCPVNQGGIVNVL